MKNDNVLEVKLLNKKAKVPTVAHPGFDLGYDLYALEYTVIGPRAQSIISTGIAISFPPGMGGIIKDRSSVASKMIYTSGGVIDNGYQGEIKVLMRNENNIGVSINAGDKIAQLVLIPVYTEDTVEVVEEFENESTRADRGFGSTGGFNLSIDE